MKSSSIKSSKKNEVISQSGKAVSHKTNKTNQPINI